MLVRVQVPPSAPYLVERRPAPAGRSRFQRSLLSRDYSGPRFIPVSAAARGVVAICGANRPAFGFFLMNDAGIEASGVPSVDETVRGMDAALEPTWTYLRRVSATLGASIAALRSIQAYMDVFTACPLKWGTIASPGNR